MLIAIGVVLLTNAQYKEDHRSEKKLGAAIDGYYLNTQPMNMGALKIYNIKRYGNGYLVLTEKYRGEGHSFSDLFLIDNRFKITAVASGNMPIRQCFSANVVRGPGNSIVFGNFKNKKWDSKSDTLVDVQIDTVKITFEDGTVSKQSVTMEDGYIIIADTASKIKDIEVYNKKKELQSKLSETFYTEYSFRIIKVKSPDQKKAYDNRGLQK